MNRIPVNPWTWQDRRGFTQAWRVEAPSTIVFVSGQVPLDDDGNLVAPGDFAGQTRRTFENLRRVLDEAGATFGDIVKLTVYVTDIDRLPDYGRIKAEFIAGPQPASTAVGVTALAVPGLMIEVEATAVL
jgi:enamine deaminase RidA (YjgF/YER057c/UK114 family)